jgi:phospholipid/cholesterol/gamma-HCH transport system substrate-binding protein
MTRTMRLGAFILVAVLLFGTAVFLIGERQFLFERTYRLRVSFDTVAGLDDGSVVRLGGVRVGTVDKIELPRRPGERITVVLKLARETREVVRKDSVATVETEGLLGAKYMALSFGSGESPAVGDGDTIASLPPLEYGDLAKKVNDIMDTAKTTLGNLEATTTDLRSITAAIQGGQGTVGALVKDRKLYQDLSATVADARRTAAEARTGVEALKHHWLLRSFFKDRDKDRDGEQASPATK